MDPFFHLITESLKKVCTEKSIEQTDRIALNTFYEKHPRMDEKSANGKIDVVTINDMKLLNSKYKLTMWFRSISAPRKSLSANNCITDFKPISLILFCFKSVLRFLSKNSFTSRVQFK